MPSQSQFKVGDRVRHRHGGADGPVFVVADVFPPKEGEHEFSVRCELEARKSDEPLKILPAIYYESMLLPA